MMDKRLPKRIQKIVLIFSLIVLAIFLLYYSLNILTNHRLHYSLVQAKDILSESYYENLGFTPDKKYSLHLHVYSWLSTECTVEATTRFSLRHQEVLFFAMEDFKAPQGPLKEKQGLVVCSKDSRYLALITLGWYADCYDFQNNKRISPDIFFMGDYSQKENEEKLKRLQDFHIKVADLIGDDTVSVLNKTNAIGYMPNR